MPSTRSRIVASTVAAALVAHAGSVFAEPNASDKALAESLFQEGKRLMTAKKWAEACPKLAESERLDPATGTLLNLAVCHEGEGRTATAWVEFNDALSDARKEKRAERVKLAQDHIAKLEQRLSRISVTVTPDARVPGLTVTRNGISIPEAAWGTSVPVDPGLQSIKATAPGKKAWENRINLGDAETRTVAVPMLEVDPFARTAKAGGDEKPSPSQPEPREPPGNRRTIGYVVGGAGVVLLAVGGYFGLRTLSQKSDSDTHCPGSVCDAQGVSASEDAHRSANLANVGVGLGLVAAGVGTWLVLTSTSDAAPPATGRLRLTPSAGPSGGAVSLAGAF